MKIVHLVVSNSFGGVEGHICTLVQLLKNSGHEFTVICDERVRALFEEKLSDQNVEIRSLSLWPRPSFGQFLGMIRLLKELEPDVLHNHLYCATRVSALAGRLAGVPQIIETIHIEEVWRKGFNRLFFHTLDAIIGRLFVDHYIGVSQAVANYYIKCKAVPPEKVCVVHNTTAHNGVVLHDKRFQFRIGFLGRLVEQKGVDVLIRAAAELKRRGYSFQILIGGDGSLEEELRSLVEELSLKNEVLFLGNISDKNSFFKMIDIFVLPSRFEGFPLVLLEAGMYEMPVIATAVSGTPEIIKDGETGLLVEKDNSNELVDALIQMEQRTTRISLAKGLQRKVASTFAQEHYIQKMDRFYASLSS